MADSCKNYVMPPAPHVLVIVQNLPVPLDRRVWLECQALRERGYAVSVICPKGPGDPARQNIDGVAIYKYRPAPQARGVAGFIIEFLYSWLRTAWLSTRVWRRQRFDVIQACNPPDTYWLLARIFKARGVAFVFDQHDLNPELFLSRFGTPVGRASRWQYNGLVWLEAMTYRTANKIVSTNESYKNIAIARGRRRPADVTVVRSGPDTQRMRPVYPDARHRDTPRTFSLVYLGIMGPQDGVEIILDVMHELVHVRGRKDVHATLLGFGDCYEDLRRRMTALSLAESVTFTGRADPDMIARHLSAADIGLCPDLKTPLNDVSTMNKTMEYMAYALPSVSFDLVETRVSGAGTVLYVESGNVPAFADALERLLDDPDLRLSMALGARRRVAELLDWRPQSRAYVGVFDELTGRLPHAGDADPAATPAVSPEAEQDDHGHLYVNLADDAELRRFILERTAP